ncbi:CHASE domain-containing protein [Actinoplanes sp. HUAS TT8]|uniref:CHASE domain-containing protein n=1 Tax=Actinoplanes sp. HUAS TT8 TaxID=3447453 RepID=UPI003F5202A6
MIVLLGLVGTGLSASASRRANEQWAARTMDARAQDAKVTLSDDFDRYASRLHAFAAAAGTRERLDAASLWDSAAPLDLPSLPAADVVSFVVPADTGQIPQVQARWRTRGATDLLLRPADSTGLHLFAVLTWTVSEGGFAADGNDLVTTSAVADSLSDSLARGAVTASPPYQLLRDGGRPSQPEQVSTVLSMPVYGTAADVPDRGRFRGWMVLGLSLQDFLSGNVAGTTAGDAAVSLRDASSKGGNGATATYPPGSAVAVTAKRTDIYAWNRVWELSLAADVGLLRHGSGSERSTWAIGAVITVLLVGLTLIAAGLVEPVPTGPFRLRARRSRKGRTVAGNALF